MLSSRIQDISLKAISGKDFAKLLEKKGLELRRVSGSHHIYVKEGTPVCLSVPIPRNKPLKVGLLKYFMRIAGIRENEL